MMENTVNDVEVSIPIEGRIEMSEAHMEMIPDVKIRLDHLKLDIRDDSDGEARVLAIEAILAAEIVIYKEDTLQLLEDIYAPNVTYIPEKKMLEMEHLVLKNKSQYPIRERIRLKGESARMLQICHAKADVKIDQLNLHDILYEFSARRNKIEVVEAMNVSSTQDFAQFGGSVTIFFDAVIPIFNVRDIVDSKGEKVLECVCIGKLTSSEDKGFDSFKGFPQVAENDDVQKIKAGKAMKVSYDGKSVKLDSNWTQSLENFWTLGDEALLTMAFVPAASENENLNNLYIVRKLMSSSQTSYINFPESTVNVKKNGDMIFNCESYDAASNKNIITNKILKKKKSGGYDFLSLAVYQGDYEINKSYFDKIVKSYK